MSQNSHHSSLSSSSASSPNLPEIVFVHGWGMNSVIWDRFSRLLQQTIPCRVTMIDLPGHGAREYHGEKNADEFLQAILSDVPEDATVIGWSLGGLLSILLAHHFPNRVKNLILVSSSPYFMKAENWPGLDPALLILFYDRIQAAPKLTLEQFLALQCLNSAYAAETLPILEDAILNQPLPHPEALTAGLAILQQNDCRAILPTLQCPIVHCLGSQDAIVPVELAEALRKLVPQQSVHIIPGAAHTPFLSHPDAFLKVVSETLPSSLT